MYATMDMEHELLAMHASSNLTTIGLRIQTHIYHGYCEVCLLDGSYIGLQNVMALAA